MHDEFRRVVDALRPPPKLAHPVDGQRLSYPGEREVRPKGPALELAPERVKGDFDVMVQKLETGILAHSHPYDASPTKVRKGTDSSDRHDQLAVLDGGLRQCGGESFDTRFGLLTKEFEREMQPVLGDPAKLRRALA